MFSLSIQITLAIAAVFEIFRSLKDPIVDSSSQRSRVCSSSEAELVPLVTLRSVHPRSRKLDSVD